MSTIDLAELTQGVVGVDAVAIAAAFGLDPASVLDLLREGKITSRCEQGIGEDAGRLRLTFFHAGTAFQLVVDRQGQVLSRSKGQAR
jgi:hypothetical protein